MATVHLGRLLGPVGFSRTVAIKRLQPQFAEDPEFVSMFLDEARLAARIRHPNVVPTLDVVSTQGEIFLVMEYVQGDSLARLIRASHTQGQSPSPAMVATLMVGVLNGLHAAHEAKNEQGEPLGIVHRDVSPHNIIVGIDGVARLLDFGVAKAAGRLQTTRDGQLKGKLAYMAPEQVRGTVTRATDVYAASVVLWEALVGRRVFLGETEAELFGKVLEGGVDPPSQHAVGIPPGLDAAIMRGIDPDPARRFATAKEMARAVADAVKLVDSSIIGEWVESLAKSTLDTRSDLVASIENDSVSRNPMAPPPLALPDIPVTTEDPLPTQLSSGSVSAGGPRSWAPPSGRQKRWKWVAAASGLAAVIVAVLVAVISSSRGPVATETPPPAAVAVEVPTLPAADPAPPPTSAAPVAPVTPAASATATRPPDAQPAPAPARRATVAAPSPPSPKKGTSCNPPYYFQGGVRIFKTECM
jgi:eukaryotic-like serine/threonine-protein kinase